MGSKLVYYIIILPLSILPLWWLHFVSSCFYLLLYYVFGYRKKVIRGNIERALPHLSVQEQRKVERQFYQHFVDIIIESLKNFTISEKQVRKRMIIENPEVVDQFAEQGKNVIFVGGHYNSWELYALAMPMHHKHIGIGIYKPLSNKFFDNKMRTSRERYGLRMVSMKDAGRYFSQESTLERYAFILASDQSPSDPKKAYWTDFMGIDTGVLFGAEKYAKQYNLPVIWGNIYKVKRGYYKVVYKVLFDDVSNTKYGEITERHTKELEKTILNEPQYWLWSHRRWKHKRPEKLIQDEHIHASSREN